MSDDSREVLYLQTYRSRNAYLDSEIESRVSDKVFRANRPRGEVASTTFSDTSHISPYFASLFPNEVEKQEKVDMVRAECVEYG